jgi:hypothetical protein
MGALRQDGLADETAGRNIKKKAFKSYSCEKWEAGSWGLGQFGKPEEAERPPVEAATKWRLVKIQKTLCVL